MAFLALNRTVYLHETMHNVNVTKFHVNVTKRAQTYTMCMRTDGSLKPVSCMEGLNSAWHNNITYITCVTLYVSDNNVYLTIHL